MHKKINTDLVVELSGKNIVSLMTGILVKLNVWNVKLIYLVQKC